MSDDLLSVDLKKRILSAVETRPAPTRREESARSAVAIGASVCAALAIFWACGGVQAGGRPAALRIGTFVGTAVVAALALWATVGRGGSTLR